MFSFFYSPHKLPPGYSKWIMQLARFDPRLLRLLRFAREGHYGYGRDADAEVVRMCEGIAKANGKPVSSVHPLHTKRIDCALVHGRVGAGTCKKNALKRWVRAFLDCLVIYLPVHTIPQLLFNLRRILSQPSSSLARILLAASRSSAFLAAFVASIYASVCLVRTRLPQVVPSTPQQPLDAGLCVILGCAVCGFSVLIEDKLEEEGDGVVDCAEGSVRPFPFPSSLPLPLPAQILIRSPHGYAMLDDLIHPSLLRGRVGDLLSTLLERLVFSFLAGIVLIAGVHQPTTISGTVSVSGVVEGRGNGENAVARGESRFFVRRRASLRAQHMQSGVSIGFMHARTPCVPCEVWKDAPRDTFTFRRK